MSTFSAASRLAAARFVSMDEVLTASAVAGNRAEGSIRDPGPAMGAGERGRRSGARRGADTSPFRPLGWGLVSSVAKDSAEPLPQGAL